MGTPSPRGSTGAERLSRRPTARPFGGVLGRWGVRGLGPVSDAGPGARIAPMCDLSARARGSWRSAASFDPVDTVVELVASEHSVRLARNRGPGLSATNVILAAGPTVVAVVAIGSAYRQQKRSFGHEREMVDLAAVRAVLDDAAVLLHRAETAVIGSSDDLTQAIEKVETLIPELEATLQRLSVRLGSQHPTCNVLLNTILGLHNWCTIALLVNLPETEDGP